MFRVDFVEISGSPDALPAEVHKSLGFQQDYLLTGDHSLSAQSLMLFLLHIRSQLSRQDVYGVKSRIVAGMFVLSSRVSKSND